MLAEVDADLGQHGVDEGIALAGEHARRRGVEAAREKLLRQGPRHGRAHGVPPADEEDGGDFVLGQGLAAPVQHADEREQPARRIEVDLDLAVSRSFRISEPSLWRPRRPMSIASMRLGEPERIAW